MYFVLTKKLHQTLTYTIRDNQEKRTEKLSDENLNAPIRPLNEDFVIPTDDILIDINCSNFVFTGALGEKKGFKAKI